MKTVNDIRNRFKELLDTNQYVEDKTGCKCLEIIGAQFRTTESSIFGEPNLNYIEREIDWYKSKSLNVNDIPGITPKIWNDVASKDGFINSNYGWCVWSDENYNQYSNVINELIVNCDSRRAQVIYTRPSMWNDYNESGKNDFMCTSSTQHFIRDNKLMYLVYMRSNDSVFGYNNDLAWHEYIFNKMFNELKLNYPNLGKDDTIIWNAASLQVYERHFNLVK